MDYLWRKMWISGSIRCNYISDFSVVAYTRSTNSPKTSPQTSPHHPTLNHRSNEQSHCRSSGRRTTIKFHPPTDHPTQLKSRHTRHTQHHHTEIHTDTNTTRNRHQRHHKRHGQSRIERHQAEETVQLHQIAVSEIVLWLFREWRILLFVQLYELFQ